MTNASDSSFPSAPVGALIRRIGNNPPIEIGEYAIMTAEYGGKWWLRINHLQEVPSDNTGSQLLNSPS